MRFILKCLEFALNCIIGFMLLIFSRTFRNEIRSKLKANKGLDDVVTHAETVVAILDTPKERKVIGGKK